MLANFGWVIPGKLAGMARPRPGQAEEIRSHGIGAVLALTETPPLEELVAEGFAVAHEPVPDFEAPDVATLSRCVAFVREQLSAGRSVLVHCHAGCGRTGTVLAAALVDQGVAPARAIAQVRSLRPGSIETAEQERAVLRYASALGVEGGLPVVETIRVALSGANGRMGRVVGPAIEREPGLALVARIEKDDDLESLAREAKADVV